MENEFLMLPMDKSTLNPCADLFISVFSQKPWYDLYASRDQVLTFFENHLNNNYFIGYVLKKKQDIIALSMGAKKPWLNGMEYYIDQFCVQGNLQGKGIGSEFLSLIGADIKTHGLNAICLTTSRGFPSEKFYLKNGFKILEEILFLAK